MDRIALFITTLVVGVACLAWLWRGRRQSTLQLPPPSPVSPQTPPNLPLPTGQAGLSGEEARAWLDNFLVDQQKK